MKKYLLSVLFTLSAFSSQAYDGHGLWLDTPVRTTAVTHGRIVAHGRKLTPTTLLAQQELSHGWTGEDDISLNLNPRMGGGDGYRISMVRAGSGDRQQPAVTIEAGTDRGLLYGAFALLRMQNTGEIDRLVKAAVGKAESTVFDRTESPKFPLRILNHWDNIDGSIERGYAGRSIFWNCALHPESFFGSHPTKAALRVNDYARANASIGINGTVINNVNASPKMLTPAYVDSVRMIADILRPWGIRVYVSVNFGSPKALGATTTADPLDQKVIAWWRKTVKHIYSVIPDFGGFLVKANSEGQPGPFDYGRTHADGANMLADALKPYGGIVMWRSFVYGAAHKGEDRVKQAVSEFQNLDGKFRSNVILQSKNGPLDFQPREPYAPIFDQMKQTTQMAEWQVTQEYLGQSRHLVYLAPMWKEFFSFVSPDKLKGIAGVSNVGDDANWCGHPFSQANWYAFGRLAWDPSLSAETIADEWLTQTFTREEAFTKPVSRMMMASREACVDYMMPLGLHHIFSFDHHYGPEPDGYKAEYPIEWCPVYYHKADSLGVGFDRSSRGTDAVGQYRAPYNKMYDDLATCPEQYLLWFHHVAWNYRMKDGSTLWQSLNRHYNRGVRETERMLGVWQMMKPYLDEADSQRGGDADARWQHVDRLLKHQVENAHAWRDTCLKYFQTFSRQPITDD